MNHSPDRTAAGRSSQVYLWLALAAVAAVLFVTLLVAPRPASEARRHPAVGGRLEAVALQPLDEGPELTAAALSGKVVVLNFWGTWCPPCRQELPHVAELHEHFRRQADFRLVTVTCEAGPEEDLSALVDQTRRYLAAENLPLPVYTDRRAATRTAVAILLAPAQFAYPTTLVLDRGGTVRGVWVGYRPGDERQVRQLVDELLAAR